MYCTRNQLRLAFIEWQSCSHITIIHTTDYWFTCITISFSHQNVTQYTCTDRLFYIYTSGTTGLPKAAIIKHCRYIWIGSALRNLSGIRPGNVIYTCIPLYHLSGGVLGTNQCLIWGDTMAIRSKFSASRFWDDCIRYNCNVSVFYLAIFSCFCFSLVQKVNIISCPLLMTHRPSPSNLNITMRHNYYSFCVSFSPPRDPE